MEKILFELSKSYDNHVASSSKKTQHPQSSPFTTLAYAQSVDGSLAGIRGQALRLSGSESMTMTHHLRAFHDCILVGVGTVVSDDPSLTVRLCQGISPLPVILDPSLRTPLTSKLLTSSTGRRPIIATLASHPAATTTAAAVVAAVVSTVVSTVASTVNIAVLEKEKGTTKEKKKDEKKTTTITKMEDTLAAKGKGEATEQAIESATGEEEERVRQYQVRRSALVAMGAIVMDCPCDDQHKTWLNLSSVISQLYTIHGLQKIMVEGGAAIITSLLHDHCTRDRALPPLINLLNITVAPVLVGGVRSINRLLPHQNYGGEGGEGERINVYPSFDNDKTVVVVQVGQDTIMQGALSMR